MIGRSFMSVRFEHFPVLEECEEVLRDVNDKGGRTTLIRVNLDEEILSRTPAAHGSCLIEDAVEGVLSESYPKFLERTPQLS